jgi:hypothetical protein
MFVCRVSKIGRGCKIVTTACQFGCQLFGDLSRCKKIVHQVIGPNSRAPWNKVGKTNSFGYPYFRQPPYILSAWWLLEHDGTWMDYEFPETVGNGMWSSQLTFTPSFFRGVAKNHQPDIVTFLQVSIVQKTEVQRRISGWPLIWLGLVGFSTWLNTKNDCNHELGQK